MEVEIRKVSIKFKKKDVVKGLYRIEGAVNLPVELFFCFSAGLSPKDKMRIRTGKRVPYDTEGQMEVNKKKWSI